MECPHAPCLNWLWQEGDGEGGRHFLKVFNACYGFAYLDCAGELVVDVKWGCICGGVGCRPLFICPPRPSKGGLVGPI
ncbi:unnamed protein product [Protopolystoma xenopodis]|uniref:Uncharacterized protein n=1 Tax=Protopolystoma xenopodis TaxID=117903 RepID=A0A448WTE4_9PLAT|nr:unnamed protein product [Protopolystoma xenopodis]